MTDHSKYNGPEPQIESVEVDMASAWNAAWSLISKIQDRQPPGIAILSISILASGAMIAGAVRQLDATIRRRG